MTDLSLPQLQQKPNKPRSTRGKWRALVLIGVHVVFIAHFVHWRLVGDTLAPIEPSETSHALRDSIINVGTVFFAVALLATLVFGRFVCGWLCHFIAVQDLCSVVLRKIGVRPKPFRSRVLLWAPLGLALYLFVWQPLAPRLFDDAPLLAAQGVQFAFTTEGFWDTFPPLAITIPFFLVCGPLVVYFLGAKGFCTYACPYGGFFAHVDRFSPVRIVVDPDKCQGTGHCTAVCTSNVRVHQEVADYGKVISPGCMKCMDCVSACPNDALSLGFAKPAIFTKTPKPDRAPRGLTWGEDIAAGVMFLTVFVASFGAYGPNLFPLLFSAGIAACAAPIAVILWNLPNAKNYRFARLQLKRAGKITPSGVLVGLVGVGVIALTAHTGYINYHRWRLDDAFSAITVNAQAFLSPNPPAFDDEQRVMIAAGLEHYNAIASSGLAFNERAAGRAAVMSMSLGRYDDASGTLASLDERIDPDDLVTSTRAELLLRTGKPDEALSLLRERTANHPTFWQSRDVLNRLLVPRGLIQEALDGTTASFDSMRDHWTTRDARARTLLQRARLRAPMGDGTGALEDLTLATEIAPKLVAVGEWRARYLVEIARDTDGAIAEMRRLTGVAPDDAELHMRLAQLGAMLRRPDIVREGAERFLELQNESDAAKGRVAELYRAVGISERP